MPANPTKVSHLIVPEVLAAMISASIPAQLAIAGSDAVSVLDNLQGGAGNIIKIPRWGAIGEFTEVAEGAEIPTVNLATSAATATVKKFARGVEITDEGLMASYADPLKEVSLQFARYATRAVDAQLIAAARATNLSHKAANTITLNDVVDAIGKWDDGGENISALVVAPKVYRDLLKLAEFKTLTRRSDDAMTTGVVGDLYGVRVRVSSSIPNVGGYYENLLLKKNALGLWYQRNVNVETERDTLRRTTVITADTIFATALFPAQQVGAVRFLTT